MKATVTAGATGLTSSANAASPMPIRLRPAATRRRPVVAGISLVVVLASAAVVGAAFAAAGRTTPVLVVIRPVGVGSAITSGDVGVASVHVPHGVSTVAAASEDVVLGRPASHRLIPGTLLTEGDLSAATAIRPGDALVGVAVTDAQVPVDGIRPGALVDVVVTAAPGSPAALAPVTTGSPIAGTGAVPSAGAIVVSGAPVWADAPAPASGSGPAATVTIEVPVAAAPMVAALSAAGQAAMIAVAGGS